MSGTISLRRMSIRDRTPTLREYIYPTVVPRTSDRDMERMRTVRAEDGPLSSSRLRSPSNTLIFADNYGITGQETEYGTVLRPPTANSATSLQELDINAMNHTTDRDQQHQHENIMVSEKHGTSSNALVTLPSLKRPAVTGVSAESKVRSKKRRPSSTTAASYSLTASTAILADKENLNIPDLSASVGHGAVFPLGRRPRSDHRNI